jgi:hypothetical protein
LDKTIVTVLLIMVSVISAVLVFNAVYPAVVQGSGALTSMGARMDERLNTEVTVIHAAKSPDYPDVALVWVKNIGTTSIRPLERCDVFYGPEGSYQRIPFGSGQPHWEYAVENDEYWKPSATIKVTIDVDYVLQPGERYYFRIALPNGVSTDYYFSPSR